MDNFENEELRQETLNQESVNPEPEQPVYHSAPNSYEQSYHGVGAGRKESPFANSPYVMNQSQGNSNPYYTQSTYVPPVPPQDIPRKPKKQKRFGKGWKAALCAVLAIALVAGSCGITAYVINNKWEARTDMMIDSFETRCRSKSMLLPQSRMRSSAIPKCLM